jgi:hypothetical protein
MPLQRCIRAVAAGPHHRPFGRISAKICKQRTGAESAKLRATLLFFRNVSVPSFANRLSALSEQMLKRIEADLREDAAIEQRPKMEQRIMSMMLAPKKK